MQFNGQVKTANKKIVESLKKKTNQASSWWADKPPNVLWEHRTTHRTSIDETPFYPTVGSEVVLLIVIKLPNIQTQLLDIMANQIGL